MAWTVSSVRVRAPRIALFSLFGLLLACFPSPVSAQTVSPQTVEFDPSTDHDRVVGGVDVVDGYELRFYALGGALPLHVIEMGKPTAQADGKIRFNFSSLLGVWPVEGVTYEARVAAVGPGGAALSAISNQFVFPGTTHRQPPAPCTYSLSATARSGRRDGNDRDAQRHCRQRLRAGRRSAIPDGSMSRAATAAAGTDRLAIQSTPIQAQPNASVI